MEDAVPTSIKTSQSLPPIFDDLIRVFLSIEDLKPSNLRNLYALLGNVTLRTEICGSYPGVINTQKKLLSISVILFNSLEDRFQKFFLAISDVSSTCAPTDTTLCLEDQYPYIDELTVLLRCCIALLPWLDFDQTHLLKKAKILLSILSRLIHFDVNGKNEDHSIKLHTYAEDGFTTSLVEDFAASLCFLEAPCPYRSTLCALLEVFADELLAEGSSRKLLVLAESAVTPSERLFLCSVDDYHIEIVLEVMSAHHLLLFSDKHAIENALDRLKRWHSQEEFRVPQLKLQSALSLLLNPITNSAPKLFQVHLIRLVSDSISTVVSPHLMDCYLVLEKSVLLYKQHMSAFAGDSFSGSSTNGNVPLFSSCIKLATRGKLDRIIAKSETIWDSCMQKMTLEDNTELLSASITFLKEDNPYYLDNSYKDDILSVLIGLTTAASDNMGALENRKSRSCHDIYLLSSILKLMSVSMFQFVRFFKGNTGILRCCKVYNDHLVVMLRWFEQLGVRLPVQSFFLDGVMKDDPMRNKESSWMLLHFTGLLSLCFASRLDFLVKDCLSVMMALMNLIALEEGDLAGLRSLLGIESYSAAREHKEKVLKRRKKVLIRFLRFQSRMWSKAASSGDDSRRIQQGNREEDISIGKTYLNCYLQGIGQEDDDLMDFIEIHAERDYFEYSKNRNMYRKRQQCKVDMKRKSKRKAWTMMMINLK